MPHRPFIPHYALFRRSATERLNYGKHQLPNRLRGFSWKWIPFTSHFLTQWRRRHIGKWLKSRIYAILRWCQRYVGIWLTPTVIFFIEWFKRALWLWLMYYVGYHIYQAYTNKTYYITQTEVPDRLKQKGMDGKLVQSMLFETIQQILNKTDHYDGKLLIGAAPEQKFELEYEGFHIDQFFKSLLSQDRDIHSIVYNGREDRFNIQTDLYGHGSNFFQLDDSLTDHQSICILTYQAATGILRDISPITMPLFKFNNSDYLGCLEELRYPLSKTQERYELSLLLNLRGNALVQLNRLKEAESSYKEALKLSPKEFVFHNNLAHCYIQTTDTIAAIHEVSIAKIYAGRDSSLLADNAAAAGDFYVFRRKYEQALYWYRKSIQFKATFADLQQKVGYTFASLRKYDSAAHYLDIGFKGQQNQFFYNSYASAGIEFSEKDRNNNINAGLQVKPAYAYAEYCDIILHINDRPHQLSIANLLKIADKLPNLAAVYYQLGLLYYYEKDYQQAQTNLIKADNLMPFNTEIYSLLISCDFDQGDITAAEKKIGILLNQNPLNASALAMLGSINSRQKNKRQEAEFYFQCALMIDPDNLQILQSYVIHKKAWSDSHGVINACRRILAIIPGDIRALEDIANANSNLGNDNYAMAVSKNIVAGRYANEGDYLLLARLALRREDIPETVKMYLSVSRIANNAESDNYLALYYYNLKRYTESETYFHRLKQVSKLNEIESLTDGICLMQIGKFEDAIAQFRQTSYIAPNNRINLKNWFVSLKAINKNPLADENFKTALENSTCDLNDWMKVNYNVTFTK